MKDDLHWFSSFNPDILSYSPFVDNIFKLIYDIYKIYNVGGQGMTTQMIVRIDSEVKERFNKLARVEGKTSSQMVRELIEDYIKERDIGTYVDDLWGRVGGKLRSKGVKPRDVNKAIREARKSRE